MKNINDDIEIMIWSFLRSAIDNIFLMDTEAKAIVFRCSRFEFYPAVHRIKEITRVKPDERINNYRKEN